MLKTLHADTKKKHLPYIEKRPSIYLKHTCAPSIFKFKSVPSGILLTRRFVLSDSIVVTYARVHGKQNTTHPHILRRQSGRPASSCDVTQGAWKQIKYCLYTQWLYDLYDM